jgi:hypothetical protein
LENQPQLTRLALGVLVAGVAKKYLDIIYEQYGSRWNIAGI